MPLLLANFIYSRDCKLNLRKNVDTTDAKVRQFPFSVETVALFLLILF